jgi:Integrase core domain
MMGAEPGRPTELSRSQGSIQPVCARSSAAGRSFIEPGSLWQNPFVESFGSRVQDEVLSVEAFDSVLEAQTVITNWRTIYNHRRPRSSLGWRLPAGYAASLTTNKSEKPARLSQRPDRQTGAGQAEEAASPHNATTRNAAVERVTRIELA